MKSWISALTIFLCIIAITAGKSSSEREVVTIIPKEEPKVHGIFQKHGRSPERFSVPKDSSPLSATINDADLDETTSATSMQLPLQLRSVRKYLSHVLASISTICLFGSIICFKKFLDGNDDFAIAPFLVFVSVIFYFVEAANSSTARYLRNSLTPDGVDKYLDSMKAVLPRVVWEIECFHYRRIQRVGFSTGKGTRVRTENRKIVTHRASADYVFQSCKDETDIRSWSRIQTGGDSESDEPLPLPKQFTKITMDKLLLFANDETYDDYVEQENQFRCLHQNRDVYHTFSPRLIIDGYLPRVLAVNHSLGGAGTGLIKNLWYWIFTCLGLTVPYRIWFSHHCSNAEVTITKEVKGNMFFEGEL